MKHVIEFFEGHVIDIGSDSIWVRITDDVEELEAEILVSKIPPQEQKYINLGAFFTWVLYNDDSYDFVFYKETWTKDDLEKVLNEANKLATKFYDRRSDN